jgi:hypothetical protein
MQPMPQSAAAKQLFKPDQGTRLQHRMALLHLIDSLARYGPSFIREYLSRISMKKASTQDPVMPAEQAKYRKAAGATSLGACELALLSARSCDRNDSVLVAQPDKPHPTM